MIVLWSPRIGGSLGVVRAAIRPSGCWVSFLAKSPSPPLPPYATVVFLHAAGRPGAVRLRQSPAIMKSGGCSMGPVGVPEMMVIFLVALVLFGPKKLPELGKTIGKAITEFRRAQSELKSTFESHMRELEKENESIKEVTRSYTNEIYNHYNEYDSSYHDSSAQIAESTQSTSANPPT